MPHCPKLGFQACFVGLLKSGVLQLAAPLQLTLREFGDVSLKVIFRVAVEGAIGVHDEGTHKVSEPPIILITVLHITIIVTIKGFTSVAPLSNNECN